MPRRVDEDGASASSDGSGSVMHSSINTSFLMESGPLHRVVAAAEATGFETRDVESLREHYALTLREWLRRLTDNAQRAVALTDERTYRTWRLYLSASAHGFASGRLNVVQTLLAKKSDGGRVDLPLRRSCGEALVARPGG